MRGDRRRAEQRPRAAAPACSPVPDARGVPTAGRCRRRRRSGGSSPASADVAGVGERIVTTSPDVSVSTNLGGWINKVGVFAPAEAHRLPRRGPAAALAAGAGRPAHRAGHQRDEPVPAAARARARPRAARPAPAADRHRLRPVRVPRPRRPDLRPLLRGPVRRRRHAGRDHAGARGRRPPVDDHAVDRARAAGPDVRRAGVRPGARLAAVRRARRPGRARRRLAVPAPVDAADRPGAVRRGAASGSATSALRADVLAGGYRLREPRRTGGGRAGHVRAGRARGARRRRARSSRGRAGRSCST